jgi:hypothetical protein
VTCPGVSNGSQRCRPEVELRPHPLVLAVFFAQVGLGLLVLPWSAYWDHNLLLEWSEAVHEFTRNAYLRGGISGLGLVNLWVAILEAFEAWQRGEPSGPSGVLSTFDEAPGGRA